MHFPDINGVLFFSWWECIRWSMASNLEGTGAAKSEGVWLRVCTDALATRSNLIKKGVRLDVSCPRCDGLCETAQHVLRDCSFS
ncbi:hypothetical protein C1H46_007994 [Malus baccata]|uniref:Reverse transcriptase zinc-binding domain-containing protein n=1 Tax=Malus baccata TaxID=106549 RepID=A0A540N7A3_MALBA|nr:hypothetical protein C1H46_007994 [Malus baccata]